MHGSLDESAVESRRAGRVRQWSSLRWNVITTFLLVALIAATAWWNLDRIDRHESAAAQATVPITGQVIDVVSRRKNDDLVLVQWKEPGWLWHETWLVVASATHFPEGQTVKLRWRPGSTEVYGDGGAFRTPAYYGHIGLWLLAPALLLPITWLVRMFGWWRASRREGDRVTFRVLEAFPAYPTSPFRSKTAWLKITDHAGGEWYQRVMWEPWLSDLLAEAHQASARRVGRRGPMLVTTDDGRRVWWAGRARPAPPRRWEMLVDGPLTPGGTRWTFVAAGIPAAAVPAIYAGPLVAALVLVSFVSLVMLFGAGPLTSRVLPSVERLTRGR